MANTIRPINKRIGEYKKYNAQPVLLAVEKWIRIIEMRERKYGKGSWLYRRYYRITKREACDDLSIFDWWTDYLTLGELKTMRTFLREAIKLGYTGYVCFKVGASGCANGMWADRQPTTDGYSPRGGDFLYRSFTPDYTYWDICYNRAFGDEKDTLAKRVGKRYDELTTIKALEEALRQVRDAEKEVA